MSKEIKIKTPDQRLRVFVSSTLKELSDERKAARAAIEAIHLIPVMFELGARPHPPKELYRAYLEQSHIFIGLYWESYGWIADNEKISGLEDEFILSDKFPKLIYVKEPSPDREPRLNKMLDSIRSSGNVSYKSFSTIGELSDYIENDLAILISERFHSFHDDNQQKKVIHNNLPAQLPHLIGREREKSEISGLLLNDNQHLVTITGPGGIGKTRLSQAVGKTLVPYFENGIYFVDLSRINDEKSMYSELIKTLGISVISSDDTPGQIAEFISDQKMLLILDNFEQLSSAADKISELISRCTNLYVIVTSRNPLMLSIETEFNLNALQVPDSLCELSEIEMSPSVLLFSEKARAADKKFELTKDNIHIVSDICRMLGGIPLAIELAAVKVRILSLSVIKERLLKKLDLLSGGLKDAPERHKTMKAAIEWSYDLLNESEKILFRRLSLFAGSFHYDAIENICCYDMDNAYEIVDSLLIKNFFRKKIEINGVTYFEMLELLNKYSKELMEQSGESGSLKTIFADYYIRKIKQESDEFYGAIETKINSIWESDIQNVMIALETLQTEQRYPELIETIYAMWPVFWIFNHDKILEKNINLGDVLKQDGNFSDTLYGKLNWIRGSAAMETGDFNSAFEKFKTANYYFTMTNNLRGISWTNLLINSLMNTGEKSGSDEILQGFNSAAELFKKSKDLWGESVAMQYTAAFEMNRGNFEKALKIYDACQRIVGDLGSHSLVGYLLSMKSLAYIEMNQCDNTLATLKEAAGYLKGEKLDEAVAYSVLILTYYFFTVNENIKAMYFAGLFKNIFSKFNFVPWHMIMRLFNFIDDKIKVLTESELIDVYQKGFNVNVYKAASILYAALHEDKHGLF